MFKLEGRRRNIPIRIQKRTPEFFDKAVDLKGQKRVSISSATHGGAIHPFRFYHNRHGIILRADVIFHQLLVQQRHRHIAESLGRDERCARLGE